MVISKKKSGIIFLEDKNNNKISKKYKNLKIKNYKIVNKYKYLGLYLDNNMNLKENTKHIIKKLRNR